MKNFNVQRLNVIGLMSIITCVSQIGSVCTLKCNRTKNKLEFSTFATLFLIIVLLLSIIQFCLTPNEILRIQDVSVNNPPLLSIFIIYSFHRFIYFLLKFVLHNTINKYCHRLFIMVEDKLFSCRLPHRSLVFAIGKHIDLPSIL